jgi:hypothetical protein
VGFFKRLAAQGAPRTPVAPVAPVVQAAPQLSVAAKAAKHRHADDRFDNPRQRRAVTGSVDLERILKLPRRPVPDETELERMRTEMTRRLSNGRAKGDGCRCAELNPAFAGEDGLGACITELRDIQAWYLYEAAEVQGAMGPIAVGAGKTGIDVLTAMVVPDCTDAVLLIPPGLKAQFLQDYELWAQHFKVPNIAGGKRFTAERPTLHVLKYSELSAPGFSSWFALRPEITVVIADEAQALKDQSATRVGRFLAHFEQAADQGRDVRFFFHTGSLTSKGIEDYSHLAALGLGDGSPVPHDAHVVGAWGQALNPPRHGEPAPPGALLRLCAPGETVERGFNRRLIETPGVVATFEGSLTGVELRFGVRKPPPMPPEVREALEQVRGKMVRPDGEELKDALEVASVARQVACGFFMFWNFPGAKPEDFELGGRVDDWFAKRQAWNREVRNRLKRHTPDMDSEGLLKKAAQRHLDGYRGKKLPVWESDTWEDWSAVEKTLPHETRTKWVSDWLARDAAEWGAKNVGIIWTQNPEMGRLIAKLGGFTYYGAGDEAAVGIRAERGDRTVVASIQAHHKGRNLQAFSRNLIVQPPSDAGVWEQLLGRTHRSMQRANEVTVEVYQHVQELAGAFEVAMGRAQYVKSTLGADQKLLAANKQSATPLTAATRL